MFTGIAGLAPAAARAAEALPFSTSASLDSTATLLEYTIDLGTLPPRPAIVVEVTPDGAHAAMQLELRIGDWDGTPGSPGACPGPSNFCSTSTATGGVCSASSSGAASTLAYRLWGCDPRPGAFAGGEATVSISALGFGGSKPPANVEIVIRGETQVPTSTLLEQVDTTPEQQSVSLSASKDTVLYADVTTASNGAGAFLWAGQEVAQGGIPPLVFTTRSPRNSLIAFDVADAVPPVALIDDVDLHLDVTGLVGGGGAFSILRTAGSALGTWSEGSANAAGTEFEGAVSPTPAADWSYRTRPDLAWSTPGGDVTGPVLSSATINTVGPRVFSTPNLIAAIQDMVTTGDDDDGFLLRGPGTAFSSVSTAIQIASSENPVGVAGTPPSLVVLYTPAVPWLEGNVFSGVVSFIGEGEDFRWIYDLDHDDIFETDIGGVCEALAPEFIIHVPYTYTWTGTPGYTGVDCCTWQIDSPQTGTVGTGQALFFHNLDAGNPANLPPDSDGDAIRDNCDNCITVPNGPAQGSCIVGTLLGAPCHADAECGPGGDCSLGQEDSDGDFEGDACDLPEPGVGVGLAAGLAALSGLARRSRTCSRSRSGRLSKRQTV
ncbi:MAG: hypothetical protein R3F21_24095 [Myxococcota bacterium]